MTSMMQRLLKRVVQNDSLHQLLELKTAEKFRLLAYLHDFNAKLDVLPPDDAFPAEKRRLLGGKNHYFQLPCCGLTRQKRAQWLEERGWIHRTILLLGDDDLLSVELCARGFTNVVVADCDEKVLREIDRRCRSLPRTPWLVQADFASSNFSPPCEADIVCLDPPNNLRWVKVFMAAGLRCLTDSPDATLLLMVNPCSLGAPLHEVIADLGLRNIELRQHQPFFNAYPIWGLEGLFLRTLLFLFHGYRPKQPRRVFFGSDLFEFHVAGYLR